MTNKFEQMQIYLWRLEVLEQRLYNAKNDIRNSRCCNCDKLYCKHNSHRKDFYWDPLDRIKKRQRVFQKLLDDLLGFVKPDAIRLKRKNSEIKSK
jgi:hypothetical protein